MNEPFGEVPRWYLMKVEGDVGSIHARRIGKLTLAAAFRSKESVFAYKRDRNHEGQAGEQQVPADLLKMLQKLEFDGIWIEPPSDDSISPFTKDAWMGMEELAVQLTEAEGDLATLKRQFYEQVMKQMSL